MSITDLIVRLKLQAEQLQGGLQNAQTQIKQFSRDVYNLGKGMTMAITAPVIGLLGGLAKTGIEFKAFKEEARAAFSVLLGSRDLADQFMDDVLTFARTTPFAFPDLIDGTRKMVAFGIESGDSLRILEAITETVAAMGGGAPEIASMSDIFAKINTQGRITRLEINRLGNEGVNAMLILANQAGVSMPEMSDMVSKGMIDSATAIDWLVDGIMNGTEGISGATVGMAGSLEAVKATWKGTMDSFKAAWRNAGDAIISDDIFEQVKEGVRSLTGVINNLPELLGPLAGQLGDMFTSIIEGVSAAIEWFFGLDPVIQQNILMFGALLVAAGPLLMIVGQVGLGVSALIGVFGFLLSPVGLVIAAIVGLVAIFLYFWNTNEEFRDAVIAAWEVLKDAASVIFEAIVETVMTVVNAIKALWEEHGEAIMAVVIPVWEQVVNTVTTAIEIVKNIILFVLALIRGDWESAWNAMKAIGVAIWNYIKNTATNIFNALMAALSLIWTLIRERAIQIWENMKQAIVNKANEIRESIIDAIQRAVDWIRTLPGQALQWGRDLIQGFINGVRNMASALVDAVKGVIGDAIEGAKNLLGIESPSTVFYGQAVDVAQGFINGLRHMQGAIVDTMSSVMQPNSAAPAFAGAGAASSRAPVNINLHGLFAGANITIGSENDAKSLVKQIYEMASGMARSEGYNL